LTMHPILIEMGGFTIHTYGFLIAVGFLLGASMVRRLAVRSKLPIAPTVDLTFYILLWGLVGGRLLYVITQWEDYASDPLGIFRIWEGGFVFFGGMISGTLFVIWYFRKHRLNPWKT